jgi:hypothetical protein
VRPVENSSFDETTSLVGRTSALVSSRSGSFVPLIAPFKPETLRSWESFWRAAGIGLTLNGRHVRLRDNLDRALIAKGIASALPGLRTAAAGAMWRFKRRQWQHLDPYFGRDGRRGGSGR